MNRRKSAPKHQTNYHTWTQNEPYTIHRKTTFKLRIQDLHIGLLLHLDAINKAFEKQPGLSPHTLQLLT